MEIKRHGQRLTQTRWILRQWETQLPTPHDRPSHKPAHRLLCGRPL